MKKKNTMKKVAGLVLSASFVLGATSCSLIKTDSEKDMAQVIARVDITGHKNFKAGGEYASFAPVVKKANEEIYKRDLIAYYLNVGSSYVNQYGYGGTFNILLDSLIDRKIMVQYAMTYFLQKDEYSVEGHDDFVDEELTDLDAKEKSLLEKHSAILTLKYFLTDFTGAEPNSEDYDKAVYSLQKAINSTLDSSEEGYIKELDEEEDETFGGTRATPNGVGSEKEDYYSKDYGVYTGHNTADSCGTYERLDGSTQFTRRKAYNDFLANLAINNLIKKNEKTTDFTKMDYYYVELSSQLEQALINKLSDDIAESEDEVLTDEYVSNKYDEVLALQKEKYDADPTSFVTAISTLSDSSFVLYSPFRDGTNGFDFGFVYNILLPYSATDSQALDLYRTGKSGEVDVADLPISTQKTYYNKRAEILENVVAKDLRGAWISNNKDKNYSFVPQTANYYDNGGSYLFFEDHFGGSDQYKELKHYLGKYPYNGSVIKEADKIVAVKANPLKIDAFIGEMEGYINYSLGKTATKNENYAGYVSKNGTYDFVNGKIDYSQFIYYMGSVGIDGSLNNLFDKTADSYKAVSAVNEIMFAYSTDTGCLNTYLGYTMSSLENKYVPEFAYAAQTAVSKAVELQKPTYVVCATEYGWHIMYVSVAYAGGNVYDGYIPTERDVEGTFSNLWFEALKANSADISKNKMEKDVLGDYDNKDSVKKYKERYEDLLNLG